MRTSVRIVLNEEECLAAAISGLRQGIWDLEQDGIFPDWDDYIELAGAYQSLLQFLQKYDTIEELKGWITIVMGKEAYQDLQQDDLDANRTYVVVGGNMPENTLIGWFQGKIFRHLDYPYMLDDLYSMEKLHE